MDQLIEVTCECSKVFRAKPEHAGRTGTCRACGAVFEIPILELEVAEPIAKIEAVVLASTKPASFNPATHGHHSSIPGEPWFYSFFELIARVSLLACFLASGVVIVFAMGRADPKAVDAGLAGIVAGTAMIFSLAVASAGTLLAVDIARNIRAIRYK